VVDQWLMELASAADKSLALQVGMSSSCMGSDAIVRERVAQIG